MQKNGIKMALKPLCSSMDLTHRRQVSLHTFFNREMDLEIIHHILSLLILTRITIKPPLNMQAGLLGLIRFFYKNILPFFRIQDGKHISTGAGPVCLHFKSELGLATMG